MNIDPGPRILAIVTRLYAPINVTVKESSTLRGDLEMDAADIIEFAMEIEDTFNLTLTNDQIDVMQTVGDMISSVKRLKWWN